MTPTQYLLLVAYAGVALFMEHIFLNAPQVQQPIEPNEPTEQKHVGIRYDRSG